MTFFPFIFKSIVINGDIVSFIKIVDDKVEKEKKLSRTTMPGKYFNYDIECKFENNSFVIGPNLSSFRTNLSYMPIIRFKIISAKEGKIKLLFFVYPFLGGVFTLILGFIFCVFVIRIDISRGNSPLPIIALMLSIYLAVIYLFNVRSKQYLSYLNCIIKDYKDSF